MSITNKQSLLTNSRFYVLSSSVLISFAVMAWLRLQIPSDQLYYIRSQQVFGLLSIIYWYVALIFSPVGYVIGKHRMRHVEFTRRAIGVSAFYFALLHGVISLWGQLGGLDQLQYLPDLFRWSLAGGAVAFVILFALAGTSFDRVVQYMTFKRWKWVHRFIYIGGVLAILHIWTIGTHLAYTNIKLMAFLVLVILAGLEMFRVNRIINAKYLHLDRAEAATLFLSLWVVASTLIASIPFLVQNYHSRHSESHVTEEHEK